MVARLELDKVGLQIWARVVRRYLVEKRYGERVLVAGNVWRLRAFVVFRGEYVVRLCVLRGSKMCLR